MKSPAFLRPVLKTVSIVAVLGLASCSPTRYVAATSDTGTGYFDSPIDNTSYVVSFHGNSNTSIGMVTRYSLFRAAELTKARGFDYFRVEDTQNSEHVQTSQSYSKDKTITTKTLTDSDHGDRDGDRDHSGDHNNHGSTNSGTVTDVKTTATVNTDTQTDYTIARTIRLYNGVPPAGDPDCYVATSVLQTMAPYVQR